MPERPIFGQEFKRAATAVGLDKVWHAELAERSITVLNEINNLLHEGKNSAFAIEHFDKSNFLSYFNCL